MADITANRLLSLLADIERALPALESQPAIREVGSQVKSSGFGSRPPGDLSVIDLTWAASDQAVIPRLLGWAQYIAAERTHHGDGDPGPAAGDLTTICAYLRPRLGFITAQPWAEECEHQWAQIRRQLARAPGSVLHDGILERMPCHHEIQDVPGGRRCPGTIVTRVQVRDHVVSQRSRCADCGTVYSQADMTALVEGRADADIVTAADAIVLLAAENLTVTVTQIWQWASRGAIARHGMVGREQTYSLTDLRAYAMVMPGRATVSGVGDDGRREPVAS